MNVRGALAAGAVLAVAVLLEVGLDTVMPDGSLRLALATIACSAAGAAALGLLQGLAGQLSLGHAGFTLLGAYGAAIVASEVHGALGGGPVDFLRSCLVVPPAIAAGTVLAATAGALVGLPSLRLRGDYLAVVTLAFAEVLRLLVTTARLDAPASIAEAWARVTAEGPGALGGLVAAALRSLGGENGYAGLDGSGVPLAAGPFWVFGGASAILAAVLALKLSPFGRALRALREDELAASAAGLSPRRLKLAAFLLSAAGAGAAGALFALARDASPVVQPENYRFTASFDAVAMVVLGGAGSVTGAVVGATLLTGVAKGLELVQGIGFVRDYATAHPGVDLDAVRLVVVSALLVVVMIRRPEGLFGEGELPLPAWARRRPRTTAAPVPEAAALPVRTSGPALEVCAVAKRFGGVRALAGVTFSVPDGCLFGVIGPNGAGKTTLFNAITGFTTPDEGDIRFFGRSLTGEPAGDVARAGVARTFQNVRLFGRLTVLENLLVPAEAAAATSTLGALLRPGRWRRAEAAAQQRATTLLARLSLEEVAHREASTLPYGHQRRVEIGRALMARPRLLLLDEPAAGMSPAEARGLGGLVSDLRREEGLTVILVEHNVELVLGVCDRIHVMEGGASLAEGTPAEVKADPRVIAAYLGEEPAPPGLPRPEPA